MKFNTQVTNKHYRSSYDDLPRFVSYYHQINTIRKLKPRNVLEVGVGNKTTSNYLKQLEIKVTTADYDKTLNPDFLADIRKLPFKDDQFDCTFAFEILEHLPFSEFEKAICELIRVSKKYVVISIPYSSVFLEVLFRFPFIKKIIKKEFLRIFISLPFSSHKFLNKEHYWELGRRGYSKERIKKKLRKYSIIKKEFRPAIGSYHYFFVLEKKL